MSCATSYLDIICQKNKNIYLKVKLPEKVPYPSLFNFNYRKKGSEAFELLTFNQ